MPRLTRGSEEDEKDALDLRLMSQRIDELLERFEEEGLTANEALWTSAVLFLSVFNATDAFANSELLSAAARSLLKEAVEIFESLPEPDEYEDADETENDEAEAAGGDATTER